MNIGVFNGVPEISDTVLISFHSFFFTLFHGSDFNHSVFQPRIHSSVSVILLLFSSSILVHFSLQYYIVHRLFVL